MFATIVDVFPTGYLSLTNETCYKTRLNFIPLQANKSDEIIQVGDQVNYAHGVVRKQMFDNCYRCHKSQEISYAQQVIL